MPEWKDSDDSEISELISELEKRAVLFEGRLSQIRETQKKLRRIMSIERNTFDEVSRRDKTVKVPPLDIDDTPIPDTRRLDLKAKFAADAKRLMGG